MHRRFQQRLSAARALTDELFSLLDPHAFYARPVPERHRLIFYLGHLEAFDWNQIAIWQLSEGAFHPTFDILFSRGIDPGSTGLPTDDPSDWPTVCEVESYRDRTRGHIDRLLPQASPEIIEMVLEHRLMHAETLSYLLHNLPYGCKAPQSQASPRPPAPSLQAKDIAAGQAVLGQPRGASFGWDNEFEQHVVPVSAFRMDAAKITNAQYLQFVHEGGPVPHYWNVRGEQWSLRGMFEEFPLPPDWPVYVTHAGAAQYAAWAGRSLMTEAEFHRAADTNGVPSGANFGFRRWDPDPAQPGELIGNGWEWTATEFQPFPGFHPEPNYPGYSADFFDGEHYVLKGASPRTHPCFLRPSFRNWFRPDYPYVYATFRCIDR